MLDDLRQKVTQKFVGLYNWAFASKRRGFFTVLVLLLLVWWGVRTFSPMAIGHQTHYKIARDLSWPGSVLAGRERNFEGFSAEVLAYISKKEKITFEVIPAVGQTIVSALESGNFDAMFSIIPPTPPNERYFNFSDPLLLIGPVLIVKTNSKAQSLSDMSGKIVGLRTGSSLIFNYLQEMSGENASPPFYSTFENLNDALEKLVQGQIDGVIMEAMPAYTATDGFYKGQLKVATPPLTWEGVRIVALNKNQAADALIKKIDDGIAKMHEDGTYNKLIDKWGLIDPTRILDKPLESK